MALRRIVERECGHKLRPAVESNTSDVELRLASQGVGVPLLPDAMPRDMLEACGMERLTLLGGRVTRRVVAITATKQGRRSEVDAALEELAR